MLPFENLTAQRSLDWAGVAASGVLTRMLSGSSRLHIETAATARAALLGGASHIVRGYFDLRDGRLRFYATLDDENAHRTVKSFEAIAPPDGIVGAAAEIARQTGQPVQPLSSANPEAVRAWGEALASSDVPGRIAALERAAAAQPPFGPAFADLAELAAASGNRDLAARTVANAKSASASFAPLDRARLDLVAAALTGDPAARRNALAQFSKLSPTDPAPLAELAQSDLKRHDYNSAAQNLSSALALAPGNVQLLNQLGYAEAFRGNYDAAHNALDRARALQPDQPNPLDSLGEVAYFFGRFDEAEKYFLAADSRSPGFLNGAEVVKAAQCRLLKGDRAGADELFKKYLGGAIDAAHPVALTRWAQWLRITGRRKQAADALAQASNSPASAPQQLIWALADRDPAAAASALARCQSGSAVMAAVCRALSGQPTPLPAQLEQQARAYSALLTGDYAGAIPTLQPLYERSDSVAEFEPRVLYLSALAGAGKIAEAAKLVDPYPFVIQNGEMLFAGLQFPRYLEVRAAVRKQQGRDAEAAQLDKLVQLYSGEQPAK